MRVRGWVMVGSCSLFGLVGCKSTGFSALQSVNPVMLGPVQALGAPPGASPPAATAFQSHGKDHTEIAIGMSGDKKDKNVTVDTASSSSSLNQGDLDVLVATSGDLAQRVTVNHLACGGYDFNIFFLYYIADAWCETSGGVSPGAPSVPAPAPAPASAQGAAPAGPTKAEPVPAPAAPAPAP
jgi:hypothetical protein